MFEHSLCKVSSSQTLLSFKNWRRHLAQGACLLGLMALGASSVQAASAEQGQQKFMQNGCWQCHGTWGQGGAAGLRLAPNPKPLAYISAFIRNSNGPMPPFSTQVLSEADLADIHAYLASIPASPNAKNIPELDALKP